MSLNRHKSVISFLLLVLLTTVVQATTVLQQSLPAMTKNAELIFEGTVVGLQAERSGKRIYTWVTFEVTDVIKGDYHDSIIKLRYLGGKVADMRIEIAEMSLPKMGEVGIYLVESTSKQTVHPLIGWGQGHFLVKSDKKTARLKIYNSQGLPVLNIDVPSENRLTKISSRIAAGVKLGSASNSGRLDNRPMDVKDFKMQLKAWR